uniref:Uncharacterized protein n=1 Tax=uncultured alpha proteobacterium EF100_102A06 TaxID=710799 RepID=E0Y2A9_9PROT|nr:hypothetical protein [uncultured alpha proteobacterium EF100_102A06]
MVKYTQHRPRVTMPGHLVRPPKRPRHLETVRTEQRLLEDRRIFRRDFGFRRRDRLLQRIQPLGTIFVGEPFSQWLHLLDELSFLRCGRNIDFATRFLERCIG